MLSIRRGWSRGTWAVRKQSLLSNVVIDQEIASLLEGLRLGSGVLRRGGSEEGGADTTEKTQLYCIGLCSVVERSVPD